jgi:hypothetical protein
VASFFLAHPKSHWAKLSDRTASLLDPHDRGFRLRWSEIVGPTQWQRAALH